MQIANLVSNLIEELGSLGIRILCWFLHNMTLLQREAALTVLISQKIRRMARIFVDREKSDMQNGESDMQNCSRNLQKRFL